MLVARQAYSEKIEAFTRQSAVPRIISANQRYLTPIPTCRCAWRYAPVIRNEVLNHRFFGVYSVERTTDSSLFHFTEEKVLAEALFWGGAILHNVA